MAALLLEIVGELTAKQIVQFIGKVVATKAVGWLTDKVLKEIFGDKSTEIIKKLQSIQNDLEEIRRELEKLSEEIKWEHLTSRIFQAEMDICHKFQLLILVLSIEDSLERSIEIKRLRKGILDSNSGILSNMYVIHKVLIGRTVTNPAEKGLLEMWSEGVYKNMIQTPMSAVAYRKNVEKYLHKSAILQLKGFILFWVANGSLQLLVGQASLMLENLKYQERFLESLLPKGLSHLTNPDKTQLFVLSASNDNVVYGGPPTRSMIGHYQESLPFFGATDFSIKSYTQTERNEVILRERSQNNEDEEWVFVKSDTFEDDGCLHIMKNPGQNSKYGFRYINVDENLPYCDEESQYRSRLFVMPLQTTNNLMNIIIYSSGDGYLVHSKNKLVFSKTFSGDNSEFTMIPTEHPDYKLTE